MIKVCEGIWKDDKMWKGTVFVQGTGKDNVKIGKMEMKDGKTEVTEKDNVKTGTIKIEDGRIISYNSPGDSYIFSFEYQDLLESIGINMMDLKEQENRIRIAIFKKMYQKQYQTNPSRNSVPQISSNQLQVNFLNKEVKNDSRFSEKMKHIKKTLMIVLET